MEKTNNAPLISVRGLRKAFGELEVLKGVSTDDRFQFMRTGYFCLDSRDSKPDALVFNRAVALKDSWAKIK